MKKLSVISIFYNEEPSIDIFIKETVETLEAIDNLDYEIIFIDDRSTDNSLAKLKEHNKKNPKIKIISFSRRFGPMESIMAGVRHATGDALVNIDIDLQDPPNLIPEMVKYWRDENFDVVFTTRTNRLGEGYIKRIISSIGYRILKFFTYVSMERDSGDFRLISRRVIDEYKKINELYPFFRFIVDWIGFKRKQLFYERLPRRIGKSHHPLGLGIFYNFIEISLAPFSDFPIRFTLLLGILSFLVSSTVIVRILYLYITGVQDISTTSIFIAILFFGSIQSLMIAVLGVYIGSVHKQSKNRPMYIIDELIGFENKN